MINFKKISLNVFFSISILLSSNLISKEKKNLKKDSKVSKSKEVKKKSFFKKNELEIIKKLAEAISEEYNNSKNISDIEKSLKVFLEESILSFDAQMKMLTESIKTLVSKIDEEKLSKIVEEIDTYFNGDIERYMNALNEMNEKNKLDEAKEKMVIAMASSFKEMLKQTYLKNEDFLNMASSSFKDLSEYIVNSENFNIDNFDENEKVDALCIKLGEIFSSNDLVLSSSQEQKEIQMKVFKDRIIKFRNNKLK